MTYNYNRFWDERGQYPAEPFNERKRQIIRELLAPIDYTTVLEFGCGNGELSKILKERSCYLAGVDISQDRLDMNHYVDAMINQDATKEYFYPISDLVICSHFLLHIKPNDILAMINNMLNVATKYLIFIEPDISIFPYTLEWENYNFPHDYDKIPQFQQYRVEKYPIDNYVSMWIVKK